MSRNQTTGQLVAVNKSRVSLFPHDSLHEACVLRSLHGHPSIPTVYAIRWFNNFEYLAMELFGQSLGDIPHNVLK